MNAVMAKILEMIGWNAEQTIYYIGGSDVLPPPLKGQQEQTALERLAFRIKQLKSIEGKRSSARPNGTMILPLCMS